MRNIRTLVTLVSLAAAATAAQAGEAKRSFTLTQQKPALTQLDLGAAGTSHGDLLAFTAQVSGENGLKGTMQGLLVTVDFVDGENLVEDRIGQITMDFGNGNAMVVAGKSVYRGSPEMEASAPQLRAITGGTGDFMGAMGQMTTTRNADGTYNHLIELVN
jgi:hypothetical protein